MATQPWSTRYLLVVYVRVCGGELCLRYHVYKINPLGCECKRGTGMYSGKVAVMRRTPTAMSGAAARIYNWGGKPVA